LIGLFHQPRMVLSDLNTLQTLPNREFIAGLAELIKYGVILDAILFEWLEAQVSEILARQSTTVERAVAWASQIKANIVAKDEKDQNLRAVLNFGHTIAHAIESIYHYEKYLHGEAVSMGMIVAMRLSLELGYISASLLDRLIALLTKIGLPIFLPDGITLEAILAKIQLDKKHSQGQIRWVLVKALGQAQPCENVPLPMIYDVLKSSGASV
ncbi:MAG TPA: 3-dehydroquinate synthase family protein, partial [Candidatus Berkiella sp.]|nr:3-dehydroquinate synthase family protein [Candidatus Berkiella sp.]